MASGLRIHHRIVIQASRSAVWDALTRADAVGQWMGEPQMGIRMITDWEVGGPVAITGFHHIAFRNGGKVLRFEPEKVLRYTHLSSISRLPDEPQNHSVLEFVLAQETQGTSIALTIENFPTESIYRHLDFYWETTLAVLKRFVEQRA